MVGSIIGILGKVAGTVAERIFPDPEHELKRLELQQALQAAVLERTSEIERAAAEVVKTEAQGQSWLQRNWRPITMLVFVSLIVARWLGWSAPNLSEAEALKLWDIVEIGLGGYVIGRSAEKVLPVVLRENSDHVGGAGSVRHRRSTLCRWGETGGSHGIVR